MSKPGFSSTSLRVSQSRKPSSTVHRANRSGRRLIRSMPSTASVSGRFVMSGLMNCIAWWASTSCPCDSSVSTSTPVCWPTSSNAVVSHWSVCTPHQAGQSTPCEFVGVATLVSNFGVFQRGVVIENVGQILTNCLFFWSARLPKFNNTIADSILIHWIFGSKRTSASGRFTAVLRRNPTGPN